MVSRAISCLLGDHWKTLNPEERQRYTDEAKSLADQYKEKNPDCWKRRSRSRSDSDAQLHTNGEEHHQQSAPLSPRQTMAGEHAPVNDNNSVSAQNTLAQIAERVGEYKSIILRFVH